MIVEDDRSITELIKEKAQMWDIKCRIADNYREVMTDFTEYQPHNALPDFGRPVLSGYHWCNEIPKVLIIFISSTPDNMNSLINRTFCGIFVVLILIKRLQK